MMANSFFNTDNLSEGINVEAKRAGGRDGKGALPDNIWETYSAFANTKGGLILLGVSERKDTLVATGIEEPDRVLQAFEAGINDPRRVNLNILTPESISKYTTESGKWVIVIDVPRASRHQRPIFIGDNLYSGTYIRDHSSDIRASKEEIARMLAEQTE